MLCFRGTVNIRRIGLFLRALEYSQAEPETGKQRAAQFELNLLKILP